MSKAYQQLRTLAFKFAPDRRELLYNFYTLNFPERWIRLLRELQAEVKNRPIEKTNMPILTLNKALRALVPDLISIMPYRNQWSDSWLYSSQSINLEAIHMVIQAWLYSQFQEAGLKRLKAVADELHLDELNWQTRQVDFMRWQQEDNGTTRLDSLTYNLLPDYLAAQLSKPHISFDFGATALQFRRVAPGSQIAELVSWPPRIETDYRGKEWAYSLLISISVQTIPFQSFPVIYFDVGIRRWASLPRTRIPYGEETTIHLLTEVPWMKGTNYSKSFQVAPLSYIPKKQQKNGQQYEWGSELASLLNHLTLPSHAFPSPDEILDDPMRALNPNGRQSTAVVYRNKFENDHWVQPGVGPAERYPLVQQLTEYLQDILVLTQPLERIYSNLNLSNPYFDKPETKRSEPEQAEQLARLQAERRQLIGKVAGEELTIEIHHQTPEVEQVLMSTIGDLLGVDVGQLPGPWETPELTLNIHSAPLGRLGAELKLNPEIKKVSAQLHEAVCDRVGIIAETLPAAKPGQTLAIIELDDWRNKEEQDADPKVAIRRGFAHTGRLTQFMTPEGDKEGMTSFKQRAKASVLDGFRQLGVLTGLPQPAVIGGLPVSLNAVGLWMIKLNPGNNRVREQIRIPVLVRIALDKGQIQATMAGVHEWLPYSKALLAIAQGQGQGFFSIMEAMPVVQQMIEELVLPLGDVLLLCHAQNVRDRSGSWSGLNNGSLRHDEIEFVKGQALPLDEFPGLRLVRVRSSNNHETPEWFAQEDDKVGFSRGLFQIQERVFASTYQQSASFKMNRQLSKVARWGDNKGPAPDVYYWNPGLYELTVVCLQPEDKEIWPWAAMIHELRNAAMHYADATALPLPLHLAQGMEEYVLRLE